MNVLDLEDSDEEIADSSLDFVSRRAEEKNLYEKESTMGLAYIYQRNNLYIEYLSEEQLSLLRQSLESGRSLITDEIQKMVWETFREVIRVRKPEDWEDETRFLYPETEGRKPKIPNQALVLGISNAMEYGTSGELLPDRYRREKYEYLDRIKKEKEKETATSHTFAGNSPRTRKTSWLSSNMWKAGRQKMISWKNCALLPLL